MSKKRNRQPDANPEQSEGSTESCDDSSTGNTCHHLLRAMNLGRIKRNIKKSGISTECLDCKKNESTQVPSKEQDCETEQAKSRIWICLQCGNQACGREKNGHAVEHFKKPFSDCHSLVVDTRQWTVWCYKCEIEINASYRKKLLETVMFVKKLVAGAHSVVNNNSTQSHQSRVSGESVENSISDSQPNSKYSGADLPKVAGLANLGNTCFFNAVLQCLAQTPFLVKVLDDLRVPGQRFNLPGGRHKAPNSSEEIELPPIEGTLEGWGSFTSILYKTLIEMQSTKGHETYNPSELLNSFKKKTMQCMDGGQHDSHELLRHLLEIVRNEDLRRYQSVILKEVGLNEKTNPDGVEDALKSRVKFYGNQASAKLLGPELVFRGVLVSTLECLECHHVSTSTEPFLDLNLPVIAAKPQPPHFKVPSKSLNDHSGKVNAVVDARDTLPSNSHRRRKTHEPHYANLNNSSSCYSGEQRQRELEGKFADNTKKTLYDNANASASANADTDGTTLEADESDADVEDNIEMESLLPEVWESGYSSEKASALSSPVSQLSGQVQAKLSNAFPNGFKVNCSKIPPSNSENTVPGNNSSDLLATHLSRINLSTEPAGSSASPDNDGLTQSGSLPTSLAVHSDLTSPEWPSATLSSYPSPEKDVPRHPFTPPSLTSPEHRQNNSPNDSDTPAAAQLELSDYKYQLSLAVFATVQSSDDVASTLSQGSELQRKNRSPRNSPHVAAVDGDRDRDGDDDDDDGDTFEKKLRKEERETEKEARDADRGGCEQLGKEGDDKCPGPECGPAAKTSDEAAQSRNGTHSTHGTHGTHGSVSRNQALPESNHIHPSPSRYQAREGECSVQSCLNQFTALELMSGSNKVGCEACTARERKVKEACKMICTPSTKQYLISQVPAVLILHLKRFQTQRFDFRKVTKHVSFPMLLDLAPVCKSHRKSRMYALYGIVEHSGTIHGGHYVAYVKTRRPLAPDDHRWSFLPSKDAEEGDEDASSTEPSPRPKNGACEKVEPERTSADSAAAVEPPPGKWYHISDSRVSEVDERTVLQSQAYLLFYERIL